MSAIIVLRKWFYKKPQQFDGCKRNVTFVKGHTRDIKEITLIV